MNRKVEVWLVSEPVPVWYQGPMFCEGQWFMNALANLNGMLVLVKLDFAPDGAD